jgi:hypothetical protein
VNITSPIAKDCISSEGSLLCVELICYTYQWYLVCWLHLKTDCQRWIKWKFSIPVHSESGTIVVRLFQSLVKHQVGTTIRIVKPCQYDSSNPVSYTTHRPPWIMEKLDVYVRFYRHCQKEYQKLYYRGLKKHFLMWRNAWWVLCASAYRKYFYYLFSLDSHD